MALPGESALAVTVRLIVLSAVAVCGCCARGGLPSRMDDDSASSSFEPEWELDVHAKEDWQAVGVLKRFFRENDPNETEVYMTRMYEEPACIHCGRDDSVRIAEAIVKDCRARDAEMDTQWGAAVEAIAIGIILQGDRYAIFFGLDTSGGCRMGGCQYRWKGPALAEVLRDVFRREGMLNGRYGKLYSALLRAVETGLAYTGSAADVYPPDHRSWAHPERILGPQSAPAPEDR
jgi:hypothetical protein